MVCHDNKLVYFVKAYFSIQLVINNNMNVLDYNLIEILYQTYHTLFLLDLDPKSNKFLEVSEAAQYLISNGVSEDTICVGCARMGGNDQEIRTAKLKDIHLGKTPQCLIIPGKMHFLEEEAIEIWKG